MCDDELRKLFFIRNNQWSHCRLDAQNSTEAINASLNEHVAEKFVDPTFKPVYKPLEESEWGPNFRAAHKLTLCPTLLVSPLTAEIVEDILLTWMKDLKEICNNWKLSGNGNKMLIQGQRLNADGTLEDTAEGHVCSGAKKDFIQHYPPIVLYLWYQLDESQMAASAVGELGE
jgi:hypothetical protein